MNPKCQQCDKESHKAGYEVPKGMVEYWYCSDCKIEVIEKPVVEKEKSQTWEYDGLTAGVNLPEAEPKKNFGAFIWNPNTKKYEAN